MPLYPDVTTIPDVTTYPDQATLGARQTAHPMSDISTGTWTPTPLYQNIDEAVADDGDFIQSSTSPGSPDIAEVQLEPLLNPLNPDNQVIRYRYRKNLEGGDSMRLIVYLMQGTIAIANWTHTSVTGQYIEGQQILTFGQVSSITDYSNLRLRFEAQAL